MIFQDSSRKYEKVKLKQDKLKMGIDFLHNCEQLGLYPKFPIFELSNTLNHDATLIPKRLLCNAINKCKNEFQHIYYLSSCLLLISASLTC